MKITTKVGKVTLMIVFWWFWIPPAIAYGICQMIRDIWDEDF